MKNELIRKVISSGKEARKRIDEMTLKEQKRLENALDVEHAYYSSALEGSNIDKEEFKELAKTVK